MAAFADALTAKTSWIGYIVACQEAIAPPETWRRVAETRARSLTQYGIEPDRIKIIHGKPCKPEYQYDDLHGSVNLQFWLLPSSPPPPARNAPDEPTPEAAIHVGTTGLSYVEQEVLDQRVRAFAEMLKSNPELSLCFVVRPRLQNDEPDDSQIAGASPRNQLKIEPLQLAEDWQTKLTGKYGIAGNRIVILPASSEEFHDDKIEVWLIPPGAPLPDLYPAAEEDDPSDENP